jgi:hypothetical protein
MRGTYTRRRSRVQVVLQKDKQVRVARRHGSRPQRRISGHKGKKGENDGRLVRGCAAQARRGAHPVCARHPAPRARRTAVKGEREEKNKARGVLRHQLTTDTHSTRSSRNI